MPVHIDEVNSHIEMPSSGGSRDQSGGGSLPSRDIAREELRETVRELVAEELARLARREAFR